MSCCLLVLAALIAIVGIVYPYQGNPLPDWPYNISINTLVAVFIAISKSAMLLVITQGLSHLKWNWFRKKRPLQDITRYDMASRGPWGSLRLLFHLRGRDFVATLGAIVTVLAIAMDPFAQQIIRYYSCSIPATDAPASIPRTNLYDETGWHLFAGASTVPLGMVGAINSGVFSTGATVPFNCPTGNCTFSGNYHSVGFCSTCSDATSNITVTNMTSHIQGDTEPVLITNYSLPSGSSLVYSEFSEGETFFMMTSPDGGSTIDMIGIQLQGAVDDAQCHATGNKSFGCSGIGAATCQIIPCVRTFNGNISDGNLTEHSIGSWTEWGSHSGGGYDENLAAVNVDCLSQSDRQSVEAAGYKLEPGTHWLAYNDTLNDMDGTWANETVSNATNSKELQGIVSDHCIYQMFVVTAASIDFFWDSYFNGTMTQEEDEPTGPAVVSTFFNMWNVSFDRIESIFSNVSDSMTTYIRQNGNHSQSEPVRGHAQRETTCVRVHWWWLAYPAFLAGLMLFFFVIMIFVTRKGHDQAYDWKSSPLALLYHGLDQDTLNQREHGMLGRVRDMQKNATDFQVRLTRTEKGWKLSEVG